jgi:hypothetical protein
MATLALSIPSLSASNSGGGYVRTSTPVIHTANANGHVDSVGSFNRSCCQCRVPLLYDVDRIAGLFFQFPIFGETLSLSINCIVAPVSTGLLSLLPLSVVEATPL